MDINIAGTETGRFYAGSKDTHIIYDSHLQIVGDRARHESLKAVQKGVYPTSIIVTPAVLQLYHDKYYVDYTDKIRQESPNAVWYLLPAGTYGASKGHHCNGIRYGLSPSDYASLPQIKSLTGE